MEVKLSPELERKVRDHVGGPYASPSDVIEQALRSFFGPETLTEAEREDLNRSIDAGLEALARGDVINGDDARNAAIARLSRGTVIASEAKQSGTVCPAAWIASSLRSSQ